MKAKAKKPSKPAVHFPDPHVVKLHTAKGKKVVVIVPGGYVADLKAPIVKVEPVGPWAEAWRIFASFFK